MTNHLTATRLGLIALLLVGAGWTAHAQQAQGRPGGDRQIGALLQRIEANSRTFHASLDVMAGQGQRRDGWRDDDIIGFMGDFEGATAQFRERYDQRRVAPADAQELLDRASVVDSFMRRRQLDPRAERDWVTLRVSLDQLARSYGVSWRNDTWVDARHTGQGGYADARLTGTYRLDLSRSDNVDNVVARATSRAATGDAQRLRGSLTRRLEPPDMLALERRGRTIMMASSRAGEVTFEADGSDQVEQRGNGRSTHTTASLSGDRLTIDSTGDRASDYQVVFLPAGNGRDLRVTRRISDDRLSEPVVATSVYIRTSELARRDVHHDFGDRGGARDYPVADGPAAVFYVPDGTELTALLNDAVNTRRTRPEDRFSMTVRSPAQYEGATLEGYIGDVNPSGRVSGRAQIAFEFERIRLRDGRTADFAADIDSVRTTSGEVVRVDHDGRAQDESQSTRTVTRTGIGAAIGAVIGAIVGGGEGAAIGGVVGAGAGAGSVYVQGRDDLELTSGTEFMIRASAPR